MLLCFLSRLLAGLDSDLRYPDGDSQGVTWLFEDGSSPSFSTLQLHRFCVQGQVSEGHQPMLGEIDTTVTGRMPL